jgi:pseudouridine-5'-phosphate glycosidase
MLHIADEARAALERGRAVVALESTIIAHGLPYPDNLAVAHALEAAVRARGAVPATIAVFGGTPRVGLGAAELEHLARHGRSMAKAGAADLSVHMARGSDAATTVSGTAFLAARAGIRLFATGGIGGVHRGDTGDVSSDLPTLAGLPIACVSSGAKAILDLPRTLETLETLGVLVVGYRTAELPAFYTRTSGLAIEHQVASAEELAGILAMRFDALGQGGVLVANPIPAEAALDGAVIDAVITGALQAAEDAGIRGKALTPFLLARIAEVTEGRAVAANRALAESNAALAAEIAVAYCARRT